MTVSAAVIAANYRAGPNDRATRAATSSVQWPAPNVSRNVRAARSASDGTARRIVQATSSTSPHPPPPNCDYDAPAGRGPVGGQAPSEMRISSDSGYSVRPAASPWESKGMTVT